MEAPPSSPFKMPEADFLFELLIVALDSPTQFRQVYQTRESDVFRKRRELAEAIEHCHATSTPSASCQRPLERLIRNGPRASTAEPKPPPPPAKPRGNPAMLAQTPGSSVNAGGRPKAYGPLKALCQDKTLQGVAIVEAIMNDETQPGSTRIAAWCALRDTGFGRPETRVFADVQHSLRPITIVPPGGLKELPLIDVESE
jgi:hypothetical protein